jgi:hypothetical protein
MVICAKTAQAEQRSVLLSKFLEILTDLMFGHCVLEVVFFTVDDVLRHIGVEILKGPYSDSVQHLAHIIFRMWKISECHMRMYYSFAHIASYAAASIRPSSSEGSLIFTFMI